MKLIPAIDIRNGKCVRLFQGDFSQETIYADDPVSIALNWQKKGARKIHIVDLDGAKEGNMQNIKIIRKIVKNVTIPLQVGGGIRDEETIVDLLAMGVQQVIIGTKGIEDKRWLKKIIKTYGSSIIISLDGKEEIIVTQGWLKKNRISIFELIKNLQGIGVTNFIYTDVKKDGTMTSPNFLTIQKLREFAKGNFTVAGGVSSIEQIKQLAEMGVESVIVGKALYEGMLDLEEVQRYVS